jgi:hypothetical protein
VAESFKHHSVTKRVGGQLVVARPLRAGWWTQRKQERACRKAFGHCSHPDGFVDWWCCMCSGETDGCPPQECVHCVAAKTQVHASSCSWLLGNDCDCEATRG